MKTPNPKSFFAKADRARYAIKVLLEVMADDKRIRDGYLNETRNCPQTTAYLNAKFADSHAHFSYVLGQLRNYAAANGKKIKGV